MNILLVNDDGYNALGIKVLKEVLSKYANVYISAPTEQKSGYSNAISIYKETIYKVIDDRTVAVDGTPIDCLYFGLRYFDNVVFDLVISGINDGLNQSYDTLFSGTIGAGIAANLFSVKAIALSSDREDPNLRRKTEDCIEYIFKKKLFERFDYLNINYPTIEHECSNSFKVGKIYNKPFPEKNRQKDDLKILYQHRVYDYDKLEKDSDKYITKNGSYSITPIKASYQDNSLIDELEKYIK